MFLCPHNPVFAGIWGVGAGMHRRALPDIPTSFIKRWKYRGPGIGVTGVHCVIMTLWREKEYQQDWEGEKKRQWGDGSHHSMLCAKMKSWKTKHWLKAKENKHNPESYSLRASAGPWIFFLSKYPLLKCKCLWWDNHFRLLCCQTLGRERSWYKTAQGQVRLRRSRFFMVS